MDGTAQLDLFAGLVDDSSRRSTATDDVSNWWCATKFSRSPPRFPTRPTQGLAQIDDEIAGRFEIQRRIAVGVRRATTNARTTLSCMKRTPDTEVSTRPSRSERVALADRHTLKDEARSQTVRRPRGLGRARWLRRLLHRGLPGRSRVAPFKAVDQSDLSKTDALSIVGRVDDRDLPLMTQPEDTVFEASIQ